MSNDLWAGSPKTGWCAFMPETRIRNSQIIPEDRLMCINLLNNPCSNSRRESTRKVFLSRFTGSSINLLKREQRPWQCYQVRRVPVAKPRSEQPYFKSPPYVDILFLVRNFTSVCSELTSWNKQESSAREAQVNPSLVSRNFEKFAIHLPPAPIMGPYLTVSSHGRHLTLPICLHLWSLGL